MKAYRVEIVYSVGGAFVIALCLLALFADQIPDSDAGPVIGMVSFKYNRGQRKSDGAVLWREMERLSPVYQRDTVRTADRSEASVSLKSGAEFTLGEFSMVFLEIRPAGLELELREGTLRIKSAGEGLRVRSGQQVWVLNGEATFVKRQGVVAVTVRSGSVRSDDPQSGPIIEAGQTARHDTADWQMVASPANLIQPPDGARLNTATVAFQWTSTKNGVVELTDGALFENILEQRAVNAGPGNFTWTLVPGLYYWRVRDPESRSGSFTPTASFLVLKESKANSGVPEEKSEEQKIVRAAGSASGPAVPELLEPENGSHLPEAVIKGSGAVFLWTPAFGFPRTEVLFARDPEFKHIFERQVMAGSFLKLMEAPQGGQLFWKARGVGANATGVFSEIRSCVIFADESIILREPTAEKKIDGERAASGVKFRWSGGSKSERFRLLISAREDFIPPNEARLAQGDELTLPFDQTGRFFWKVERVYGGQVVASSASSVFEVMRTPLAVETITPPSGATLDPRLPLPGFRWRGSRKKARYFFQLIRLPEGIVVARRQTERDTYDMRELISLTPGRYAWTVEARADAERVRSEQAYFQILDPVRPTAPIPGSPRIQYVEK